METEPQINQTKTMGPKTSSKGTDEYVFSGLLSITSRVLFSDKQKQKNQHMKTSDTDSARTSLSGLISHNANKDVTIDSSYTSKISIMKTLLPKSRVFVLTIAMLFTSLAGFARTYTVTLGPNSQSATSFCAGTNNNIIHSFTISWSSSFFGTNSLNITGASVNISGTWVGGGSDVSNFKLYYTTTSTFSPTNLLSTITNPSTGTQSFTFSNMLSGSSGGPYYFWITADIPSGATDNRTLIGNAMTTSNFTSSSNKSGSATASSTKTINALPSTPGAITQPVNKCAGSTGNTFSISAVSGATSYTWSTTGTGWSVTAGGATTSATITIGSVPGTVSVTATNACGTSSAQTTGSITPTSTPATPGTISQPAYICEGTTLNTFSISPVNGATSYTWSTTGTGWSVTADGTTTSATITIGSVPGTVSVTATNACGTSSAQTTGSITPTTIPVTPGTISQPANICAGSIGNIFSISPVDGAVSYTWSTTGTGWSVSSGGETTSATITAGSGIGTVSVTATNGCGTSAASSTGNIAVVAVPTVNIGSAMTAICQGGISAPLGGTVGGSATGGIWSDGGINGTFTPDANTLNATWTPPLDYSGTATLTLTTIGGVCTAVSDSKTQKVDATPIVNAGSSLADICQGGTSTVLGGSVGGSATGGIWTDGGIGGTFTPNSTTLNATWTPPATYTGTAVLTLTTSGGVCTSVSDTKTQKIDATPIANAGPALADICQGGTSSQLGGSVGGSATGGIWSDGGIGGTFNPNTTTLNATWTPPTSYSGTATLTLTSTGGVCANVTDTKTQKVDETPTANAGSPLTAICQRGTSSQLGGSVGGSATGGTWSDGGIGGTFSPSATDLNATWTPPTSYSGTATLTLTSMGGVCTPVTSSKTQRVDEAPTADAGPVMSNICKGGTSAPLGGSVGGSATGGIWSDGGIGGTFTSGATNLNSRWTPPATYSGLATLTLTTTGSGCTVTASKTQQVDAPTADAGNALSAICIGGTSAPLGGSFGGSATGGIWDDGGIGGTFTPDAITLNATWTPPADYFGTATLTLTTTGGACAAVTASKTQQVDILQTVDAGSALPNICKGGTSAPLGGSVGGSATGGIWTDGGVNGTFTPNASALNATWTPPATYTGTAVLTLTTSGATCTPVSDTKTQKVVAMPTANAGAALADICKGGTSASLGGSVGGTATGGIWSDGGIGGTFTPGATTLNSTWTPPAAYTGIATLTLTTTGSACSVTASKTQNVNVLPTASAGTALSAICQGGTSAPLGGSVGGSATGGIWSSGGTGGTFTPNATDLNATWTPPASYSGTATLTLTTTGGPCTAVTASKIQKVDATPTANAGSALVNICQGGTSAALGGSVTGSATGGTWSDGGAGGSFSPNATTLNATYTPQVSFYGTVTLTLTTTGGACTGATASKILKVDQTPTANAGPALADLCIGGTSAPLGGSVGGSATGGVWSDGGIGGTFSSTTDLNATWKPPVLYVGAATLTLTTTGGSCTAVTSSKTQMVVEPTANAGSILAAICQGGTSAPLDGSIGGTATGGIWSDGIIGGTFTPNTTTLNATWTPPANYYGTATLTLTTTGGSCTAVTATKTQKVDLLATANTGPALADICKGGTSAPLGGLVGGSATGGIWSDGGIGGTFTPGATNLNSTWTPPVSFTGTATLTLTTTGGSCTVTASKTQKVEVLPTVDAGPVMANICKGGTTVTLGGSVGGSATGGIWDDGGIGGTFTPDATNLLATWTPPSTYIGVATLTLTTTGGTCTAVTASKTQRVDATPTANTGFALPDICKGGTSVPLGGSVGGSATGGIWSDGGLGGIFNPNASTLNATWTPPATYTGLATLTLTTTGGSCLAVSASKTQQVNLLPTVDAGSALPNICKGETSASLLGSIGGSATGGIWSDGGIGGTFTPGATNLNATWTPPASYAGTATLTLTTTGGPCTAVTASKTQKVDATPIANAGSALANICQGGTSAALGGSIGGSATGGVWSDGVIGGTFTPNATTLNATWKPPVSYFGTAILTLTTTGGACAPVIATKTQIVDETPTADAGSALAVICQGGTSAPLGGLVGGSATGGIWSDGGIGGTFTPVATNLNSTWTPPASYKGTATLTLTTTGGSCTAVIASKTQTVDSPTVNAGAALADICQGGTSAPLGGAIGGTATGGVWSDGGINGNFNPDATDLNATWTPPVSFSGTATLTLTTTGGTCTSVTASKTQKVDQAPTVSPGSALADICQGGTSAPLGGSVGGSATGGIWSDGGIGGTFNPNANTLNGTWTPPSDYFGTATLTLTTTGGACGSVIDTKTQKVDQTPTANAGSALSTICQGGISAPLGGSVNGSATGGIWSDGGIGGSFSPDAADLNATWAPPTDYFGTATLTLTTTGGACTSVSDTKTLMVDELPTADAGSALANICKGGTSSPLGGSVGGSATGGSWSDGGIGGTFTPGATDLNATWTPPASYTGTAALTLTTTGGACASVTDTKTQKVSPLPTANAGSALAVICQGGTSAPLGGSIGGSATGGIWSDGGIGGTFTPGATNLNATWKPPVSYSGTATLTLTTTGGSCTSVTASKTQKVDATPTASAGLALIDICKGGTSAPLGASVGGSATGGVWADGGIGGTFSSIIDLNATWTPPASYYGTATLTLTTTGGACTAIIASKTQKVDQPPTAIVGSALADICQGGTSASLGGSVTGSATGGIWSDGGAGGSFNPNPTTLGATYTPLSTFYGTVTLTLTTTGGACPGVTASKTLNVDQTPTAVVGSALSNICQGGTSASLGGSVTGSATGGEWSDGGAGGSFNPSATTLIATYTPSPTYYGLVTLTLTTTGGACPGATASKTLQVDQTPTAVVGAALSDICQGSTSASLGGSVTGSATGGTWSDGGAGG
jgi:hypothetical protein